MNITHTHSFLRQFVAVDSLTGMFLVGGRKQENHEENYASIARMCKTQKRQ